MVYDKLKKVIEIANSRNLLEKHHRRRNDKDPWVLEIAKTVALPLVPVNILFLIISSMYLTDSVGYIVVTVLISILVSIILSLVESIIISCIVAFGVIFPIKLLSMFIDPYEEYFE